MTGYHRSFLDDLANESVPPLNSIFISASRSVFSMVGRTKAVAASTDAAETPADAATL